MSKVKFLALPLAALVLVPVSAAARDRNAGSDDMIRKLEDPRTQEVVGNAMGALIGALLQMPADPLVRVMESTGNHDAARRIPKGATLGDLAGPDARTMPREIKRRVPGMMTAAGSMLGVVEAMAPQLEAIGKQLERDLGKLD
jgi:hypothetical protein